MSKKPTLANTPQVDKNAKIIDQIEVKDAIAVYVENTCFRGSQSLTGMFQVVDADDSIWQDGDGVYHAEVFCSWHGTDRDNESLVLTLDGYPTHVIVGLDDEVVASIG